MTETLPDSSALAGLTREYSAHNYHPLPIVAASASGVWVTDTDGRRYLDMLAGYSALNFGHRHPRLVAAAQRQLERVTLVSRAFDHDQFGPFCAELAELAGMDVAERQHKLTGQRKKRQPRNYATIRPEPTHGCEQNLLNQRILPNWTAL